MFQSRNRRNRHEFYLTHDQRLLLDVYLNFYNQTTRQIDLLYELQDEIRSNINVLVGLNSNNNTFNRNFQTNPHYPRSNNQSNNIYQQGNSSQNNTENYTTRQRQNYIEGTPYLVTMTNLLRNSYMHNRNQNQNHNQNETITPIWRSFYDAVQVVPTQSQIDNATRNVNYSEIETPTNNSCPITLERFESNTPVTQILYCGHIFSNTGLNSWLRTNVRCPVCRYDIREYRTREHDLRNVYYRNHNNTSNNTNSQQDNNQQNSAEIIVEDVESNDETHEGYEETKEESIPNNRSSSSNQERNSNSRRHMNLNDELTNILTNVTEELLNGFLRPNSYQTNNLTSSLFDPSYNSFFFDSSNNQIVFEGYMRRY